MKEVSIKQISNDDLFDGRGQNKETLNKQKKVLEEKKRKTLANKKIFEDLERQADEDMLKDSERIKGKSRIFGAGKSQKAKQYRYLSFQGFGKNKFTCKNLTSTLLVFIYSLLFFFQAKTY